MMRRSVDDDAASLHVFGTGDEFDPAATEVSFGGRTPKGESTTATGTAKPRFNPWIVGSFVGVLVVGAFVYGDHSARRSAAPPVPGTRPTPSTRVTPGSVAASVAGSSKASPSALDTTSPNSGFDATTTLPALGPLYANSVHLGLFLVAQDNNGSAEVRRVDLQTGVFDEVTAQPISNSSQVIGIAQVEGGAVPVTATFDNGQPAMARGPGLTVWLLGGAENTLRQVLYNPDGSSDVLNTVPGIRATDGITLVGSTADLRPVLQLADGRGYDVAVATGGLHRLTDGMPTNFDGGLFAETVCADDGSCTLRLHGAGNPRDIVRPPGYVQTSFSPDGRTVLVTSQVFGASTVATSTLIDLGTGDADPVTLLTQNYYGDSNIAWTPDSSSFFWIEQGSSSIRRLIVESRVTVSYDISTQLNGLSLQGLAGLA